jgi:hypothetical protein
MSRLKALVCALVWWAGPLARQEPLPTLRLDQDFGIGGIAFGQPLEQLPAFETQFRKQGKPRLRTQLYKRLNDTTQLGGLGRPASYWFRQGKFIGVDANLCHQPAANQVIQKLSSYYGPPQYDAQSGDVYWLGQRTFILVEPAKAGIGTCSSVLIGSLALLNELVVEAPVRAQARQLLHWQPDSVGLPKQRVLRR